MKYQYLGLITKTLTPVGVFSITYPMLPKEVQILNINLKLLVLIGIFCFVVNFVCGILEFLSTVAKSETLTRYLLFFPQILYSILKFIFSEFKKIWIKILRSLLEPVLADILENPSPKSYILQNRPQGDDSYIDEIFDFSRIDSLKIFILPSDETSFWRFGIKFSKNNLFSGNRYEPEKPLFHLTKDTGSKSIRKTYYGTKGNQVYDQTLNNNMLDGEIFLELERIGNKLEMKISRKNKQNTTWVSMDTLQFNLKSHRFGQISAWADRKNYKIQIKIIKYL